jgi:hypothetical protein
MALLRFGGMKPASDVQTLEPATEKIAEGSVNRIEEALRRSLRTQRIKHAPA